MTYIAPLSPFGPPYVGGEGIPQLLQGSSSQFLPLLMRLFQSRVRNIERHRYSIGKRNRVSATEFVKKPGLLSYKANLSQVLKRRCCFGDTDAGDRTGRILVFIAPVVGIIGS
ncbi:hypothetical protein J0895_16325 [Phormidium pseudopriestleyi FRX01]|uniref:Uncharacterized protein n=1 Tax=Phormidium pseudopriestleyi FRX01 TaxID=1759528 RepID=A0ABS3FV41_9CYAN|nr:hypothetical protein [Phormidium pseudopriestleyi]MBO0350633.1 hypothetical protein [Phormidium pseudopriestleyi FRX01]